MTTYRGDLGGGQQVFVAAQGTQTVVTLMGGGPGQQQSQSSGFDTGEWLAPPVLFRTGGGLVLRIETARGHSFIRLQSSGMHLLDAAPSLTGANVLPLQPSEEAAAPSFRPMEPLKPMEPMKPMKPMEMRMGNMHMRMGGSEAKPEAAPAAEKRFCTQCGKPAGPADRFCGRCGSRLTPLEE